MIEKTIHYIWLSGERKDYHAWRCIRSWKRHMKDFRIREWHMEDFDWDTMPAYVKEALEMRKWAFVSDYLRLYILYHHGGIYMDSDVRVKDSLEQFMDHRFFSAMEVHDYHPDPDLVDSQGQALTDRGIPGMCFQAALMGSEPGHPFLKDCMDYYQEAHFTISSETAMKIPIAPDIYATKARKYGFRYLNQEQHLDKDMAIYPSNIIASSPWRLYPESVAVHMCAGSWRYWSLTYKIRIGLVKYYHLWETGFILRWIPFRGAARRMRETLKGKNES